MERERGRKINSLGKVCSGRRRERGKKVKEVQITLVGKESHILMKATINRLDEYTKRRPVFDVRFAPGRGP